MNSKCITLSFFCLCFSLHGLAQQRQVVKLDASSSVILQEIGAIIGLQQKSIKVVMVPPKEHRPAGMPEVDLVIGDEIGMMNGAKVKLLVDIQKRYDAAPIGSEIKLGIRREGALHIVSFVKKDPKDMPQGGMRIVKKLDKGGKE